MKTPTLKSSCCNAPIRLNTPDSFDLPEGQTMYYICKKCDMPCDFVSDMNSIHKPPYGTPSTISEIVSSIVLLAHAKGVANEGFVNVDFYIEQLEKEVEKTRQEAVKQDREHILKLSQSKRPETSWQRWLVETLALSSQKEDTNE